MYLAIAVILVIIFAYWFGQSKQIDTPRAAALALGAGAVTYLLLHQHSMVTGGDEPETVGDSIMDPENF